MMTLHQAEELHPLVVGSLLAEAAAATWHHLEPKAKLHDANSHYLLHGNDGRRSVWYGQLRADKASSSSEHKDGPCFAVVCAAECNWKQELLELQCLSDLTGTVVLDKKKWEIGGLVKCCDAAPGCECNGVPRWSLHQGRSKCTVLLPVLRTALAGHALAH
jgi:hypothetical protein